MSIVGTVAHLSYCCALVVNFTLFMAALHIADADIIFLHCGFYLSSSIFFLFLAYSQRSEIGCLLLVRISNACLKCAQCVSLEIQDAKNRHLGTIAQLCPAISSQRRHVSTIGKNLLNINKSSTCPHNMANFGPPAADICW